MLVLAIINLCTNLKLHPFQAHDGGPKYSSIHSVKSARTLLNHCYTCFLQNVINAGGFHILKKELSIATEKQKDNVVGFDVVCLPKYRMWWTGAQVFGKTRILQGTFYEMPCEKLVRKIGKMRRQVYAKLAFELHWTAGTSRTWSGLILASIS